MNSYSQMLAQINRPAAMERITYLYGRRSGELARQLSRYSQLIKEHENHFHTPDKDLYLISAPGRTEIIGNHTDHNNGRVLAAAVNLDCLSCVTKRDDMQVNILSAGYPPISLTLEDLNIHPEEEGTSAALVRGVAKGMKDRGYSLGGFDAVVTSDVIGGSGLSSSAAYEVMLCAILDKLYNGFVIDAVTRAQIAQFAENVFFGKPSGLMDQMASSTGGLVTIDFKDDPKVEPLSFDFQEAGYALIVVNTGGSHDNLTAEYASIRVEMQAVAHAMGKEVLREVRPEEFRKQIPTLRRQLGERPILRALHFYLENRRVIGMVQAIREKNIPFMFGNIVGSGESSWMLLQNLYPAGKDQPLALALELAALKLKDKGAWRVHGGGFAGTTLNFVPADMVDDFVETMDSVFGPHACFILNVRPEGASVVFTQEDQK